MRTFIAVIQFIAGLAAVSRLVRVGTFLFGRSEDG